jgi:hypothetical protein
MYLCTGNIDPGILFEEGRIKTFYCNQLDRSSVRDHGRTWTCKAEGSFDHVRRGGIYVYRRYWAGPAGKQLPVRF